MMTLLSPYRATLYSCLRIVAGLLFASHGIQKLFGAFGRDTPVALLSQMGVAGVIETVGGLAIALGLYTSPLAFLASGQMAVAYFSVHMPQGMWPITNGGELAALYCWLFLYISANGSGKWSLR
mgnify:CR=1 FL=1